MRLVRGRNKDRLEPSRLNKFRREALRRVLFFLQNGVSAPISQIDPSGKNNLKLAIQMRKELRNALKEGGLHSSHELANSAKNLAKVFLPL